MPNIFQNSLSGTIQDVPQIEALRTPDHVVLSKSTEVKIILPEGCEEFVPRTKVEDCLQGIQAIFGGGIAPLL